MWETKQGRESCTNPLTDQGSSPHLTCCLRSPHLPKGHERKVTNVEKGLRRLSQYPRAWKWPTAGKGMEESQAPIAGPAQAQERWLKGYR